MPHQLHFIPLSNWDTFRNGKLLQVEASFLCFTPTAEDFSGRHVPSQTHFIEVNRGKARFVPSFLSLTTALFIAPEPILLLGLPDSVAEIYNQAPDEFDLAECIRQHYGLT